MKVFAGMVGVLIILFVGYEVIQIQSLKQACIAKFVQKPIIIRVAPGLNEQTFTLYREKLLQTGYFDNVSYKSARTVEEEFRAKYADDPFTLRALDEIGHDKFSASITVQIRDVKQVDSLETIAADMGLKIDLIHSNSVAVEAYEKLANSIKDYSPFIWATSFLSKTERAKKNVLESCANEMPSVSL